MRRELINLDVSRSNSFHTPKSHEDAPKAHLITEDHVYVITRRYLGAAGEQVPRCRTVACRTAVSTGESWQNESSDLVVNIEEDNRGIETTVWMKTVCIRTINGSAIHKQAMSSNRVSKEDRST